MFYMQFDEQFVLFSLYQNAAVDYPGVWNNGNDIMMTMISTSKFFIATELTTDTGWNRNMKAHYKKTFLKTVFSFLISSVILH